jgi:hypothetical protein
MSKPAISKAFSIAAGDSYSAWVELGKGEAMFVLDAGPWVAGVTLQASIDGGATPIDIDTRATAKGYGFTVPASGYWYRAGVKTGDYTAGPVTGSIAQ